jgi:hypothetical protein
MSSCMACLPEPEWRILAWMAVKELAFLAAGGSADPPH